jgi:hypothetical protein
MPKKELTKDVEHAIKWIAAEFKFLKRLNSDLKRIEQEDIEKQEKDLKKDLKVVRYVGKAGGRLELDVKDVIKQLREKRKISSSPKKIGKVLDEIEIPSRELIGEGSLYVGNLKKQLKSIRSHVQVEKKYRKRELQEQVKQEIDKLESRVSQLLGWIAALEVGLKKALKFQEKDVLRQLELLEKQVEEDFWRFNLLNPQELVQRLITLSKIIDNERFRNILNKSYGLLLWYQSWGKAVLDGRLAMPEMEHKPSLKDLHILKTLIRKLSTIINDDISVVKEKISWIKKQFDSGNRVWCHKTNHAHFRNIFLHGLKAGDIGYIRKRNYDDTKFTMLWEIGGGGFNFYSEENKEAHERVLEEFQKDSAKAMEFREWLLKNGRYFLFGEKGKWIVPTNNLPHGINVELLTDREFQYIRLQSEPTKKALRLLAKAKSRTHHGGLGAGHPDIMFLFNRSEPYYILDVIGMVVGSSTLFHYVLREMKKAVNNHYALMVPIYNPQGKVLWPRV